MRSFTVCLLISAITFSGKSQADGFSVDSVPQIYSRRRANNGHQRARSSVGDVLASMGRGSLRTIREGLESEGELLREAFLDELYKGDEGQKYFLDTSFHARRYDLVLQ